MTYNTEDANVSLVAVEYSCYHWHDVLCELVDVHAPIAFHPWTSCPSLNAGSEAVVSLGSFVHRLECVHEARKLGAVLTTLQHAVDGECLVSFMSEDELLDNDVCVAAESAVDANNVVFIVRFDT